MTNIQYGLKSKLIITIFTFFGITLLLYSFCLGPIIKNHEIQEVLTLQNVTISNLSKAFDVSFRQISKELITAANLLEQAYPDQEKLERFFTKKNAVSNYFTHYSIITSSGHLLYQTGNLLSEEEKVLDDNWLAETLAQKKIRFIDVHPVKPNNQLVCTLAAPFYDKEGEPLGLLCGHSVFADDNMLLPRLKSIMLGQEGSAYLVDSQKRLIAHSDFPLEHSGLNLQDYSHYSPVQKAVNGENGVIEYEYKQKLWIASYQPIPSTGWGVILQQPKEEVFRHIDKAIHTAVQLLIGSFAIMTIILAFLVQHTLWPLVKLADAIRTGAPYQPAALPRDEIGLIVEQFNSYRHNMEEQVAQRTQELHLTNEELQKEIAERQQTEKVLLESEERYRAVVEEQTEFISRFKPDGTLTFVNDAYCRYFQKHAAQLIGTSFFAPIPEEDHAKVGQCLDGLTQVSPVESIPHRILAPLSRMYRWHHTTIRAIFDSNGYICEFQSVGRDITKRTTIENALRLSEQRFRGAFEAATHGIALVGLNGDWLRVNKALCQIVGYSEDELLQTNFQHITHPDDLEKDLRNVQMLTEGKIPSYQMEKRYFHKQGQIIWILLSVSLVHDGQGKPMYFVSQVQDFTARKRAEEALISAQADLEVRVHQRTAELAGAYDTLRKYVQHQQQIKEKERQSVAREIHDELGQSLTGIKMGLFWLNKKITAGSQAQETLHNKITALTDLADTSINTVRKISMSLRPGLLDELGLVAALEWHVKEYKTNFDIPCHLTHNIDDDFTFNSDISTVLYRICQEALTNISRHAQATQVQVRLEKNSRTIILTIEDNGMGITPEQIANPQSFGLLGMKERAFPLGGTVAINGEKDKGSYIRVTIPLPSA